MYVYYANHVHRFSKLGITKMKSIKVQNPRRIPSVARSLARPRGVAVLPGRFSLLRGKTALVCLVLG